MDKFTWTMLLAIMTMCFGYSAAQKVSETDCTKDTANQCKHTPNAECDNAETNAKCKCSDGFAEDKTDGSTCVKIIARNCSSSVICIDTNNANYIDRKCTCNEYFSEKNNICVRKVSETDCTKDIADQCKHTLNAECDNAVTDAKCKCSDGFAEDKTDGSTCVKKVSETDCTKDAADQCKHTPNAECNNAASAAKCKCSDGFAEDKTDGSTCAKTVEGTSCTDGGDECVENSHCDNEKCKCDAGYVMNVDVCTSKNAAPMVQFGWMTILLGVLTITQSFFL